MKKKKRYPPWYKMVGLKHVTGFVSAVEREKLRRLAKLADKSLSRYVTRVLQQHIKDVEEAELKRRLLGGEGDPLPTRN